ncbi:MAG: asparagine synthase (glutamine-hydrolyzing) [Limnohabitans sp.]|nr:asparagine synthase (glutamine-hydrolyzing) [Limnohabitans sp.]
MCGIYITNISFSEEEVKAKLKSIEFRGPDNLGFEKLDGISFGHLRLSIIDLDSRSDQPFSYKHLKIVFNGEIYNFKDIRNELIEKGYSFSTSSDTEVLLKGYDFWGKEVLDKLNGMFAFSIYDSISNKIFSARDRLGVKPFYYSWKDSRFEICSQLRPLITKNSKVSEEAISIYLDCGYVPSPYSIIEGIYKLPPGNYMEIDLVNGTKTITEFWNLKPVEYRDISYEQAKEELHKLLVDAVKIRLESDVPLGTFLSGGIDSALVSSIAAKVSQSKINTFTIGFEDPKYDESKVAKQFAEIIGSNHIETICGPNDALEMLPELIKVYDEPFADSSALPSLLLNKVTKKYATVALSGDGGDESFLGYTNYDLLKKFKKIEKIPFFIRKIFAIIPLHFFVGGKSETIKSILTTQNAEEFGWKIFTGFDTLQKKKIEQWERNYSSFKILASDSYQQMADLNIKLWLENDSNVKVDRASMASQVEVRSPFLDYRIIELARSLPVDFRYKDGVKKKMVRDILKEYIPEEVFNQPKRGFAVPLGSWIRENLKEEVLSELNDEFLKCVPNLDVLKFKKQLKAHFDSNLDYSNSIWKLFLLAKWYKEFKI